MHRRGRALAITAVFVLGLVGCGKDDSATRVQVDPDELQDRRGRAGPQLHDHWHIAVGMSRCGEELADPQSLHDPLGIHSHGDGVIHIHPFTPDATGDRAVLGLYLEAIGAEVSTDGLEMTDGSLPFEGRCGDEPAQLVLVRWESADDGQPTRTALRSPEQLVGVRLDRDGAVLALALVAQGEDVPLPRSAATLSNLSDVSAPPPAPSDATGQGTIPVANQAFALAPVLGVHDPPCGSTAMPSRDASECYELGPVVVGADAVADASAEYQQFDWVLHVTLSPDGGDDFRVAARACFERNETCPSGQLAILVESDVIAAPTVQEADFEDELVVSGGFTEEEARALAKAMSP